jgi:hypothetical protein
MATWKKLLVSGSNISQLNNDAGYLTAETGLNAFATASFNGTHLISDSNTDTLNFASSSGQGLTISADAGTDTLTFGLSAIPNASLEHTSVSFGGITLNLGESDATPAFDLSDASAYPGDSNLVTLGTVTSGDVSAILPAGTISGSVQVDYLSISNVPSGILSASVLDSPNQGEARLTLNGVQQSTVDLGLQTTDSPTFAGVSAGNITVGVTDNNTITTTSGNLNINATTGVVAVTNDLTVGGNLVVSGDTINANVTNLDIEDRYILLNSGSATIGDSGIVFGGSNGTAQEGAAVIWDASYNSNDGRLAIVNDIASNATGDQTPSYHVAGVFEGTEANAATAQADHVGNIRVEGGDIFIYV